MKPKKDRHFADRPLQGRLMEAAMNEAIKETIARMRARIVAELAAEKKP